MIDKAVGRETNLETTGNELIGTQALMNPTEIQRLPKLDHPLGHTPCQWCTTAFALVTSKSEEIKSVASKQLAYLEELMSKDSE